MAGCGTDFSLFLRLSEHSLAVGGIWGYSFNFFNVSGKFLGKALRNFLGRGSHGME